MSAIEMPDNLPPLPPVPEGYDRWEYRGMGWQTENAYYDCCPHEGGSWTNIPGTSRSDGMSSFHYIEAVKGEPRQQPAKATGIEALVAADIAARQRVGIAKYGTTIEANPLPLLGWLRHAYEECLDQAVYLRRAIAAIEGTNQEKP
jgi:hypothetical protein